MEIQYVYMKTRSQFGKQCVFDNWGPTIDENLNPNGELMSDYIFRDPCNASAQKSTQQASHEMQTKTATARDNGMNHTEGGWPKEINFKDDEATTRFRRRVEKEDIWGPKLMALIEPMEHYILQNNAVNIYENYFDDMIPTKLMLPLGIRTVNVYSDPQINVRPITNLSWSPDRGNKLAVAYCCMEFQRSMDLSPYAYIWDIENPNKAFMALKSSNPSVDLQFNPRDPSVLISGLMSGQVCYWDIRTGNRPVQISHLQFSHRNPANLVLWINSKTNAEFFSASTDGLMKWWDTRKIREPTETLVMDLNNPQVGDVVKATGVSSMNFEPTMGTKFMVGMENGYVVSGSRKGKNAAEKLALRFNCHYGPVVGLDRNPFSTKNFLTVGDWTARIWAEDTKESCLLSTPFYKELLTGGCWSTSRYSVFYVINMGGELQVWDILVGMEKPVTVLRLCDVGLRAIKPQEDGKLIAVGNVAGNVYLIEPSEALTTNTRNDKALMTSYLDRDSRYEKAIDNRLKEVRLMQRADYGTEVEVVQPIGKKGKMKDKGKDKGAAKKDKVDVGKGGKDGQKNKNKADEKDKKKGKAKKGKETAAPDDPELAEAEVQYYAVIQKEIEKYVAIEDPDEDTNGASKPTGDHTKKKKDEKKGDKEGGKKEKKKKSNDKADKGEEDGYVIVKKKPDTIEEAYEERLKRIQAAEEAGIAEEMAKLEEEKESEKSKTPQKSARTHRSERKTIKRAVFKPCEETVVCDPNVCCRDVKTPSSRRSGKDDEEAKGKLTATDVSESELKFSKLLSRHSIDIATFKEYSTEEKRAILREKDARPNILEQEVRSAKKEMREDVERMKRVKTTVTPLPLPDKIPGMALQDTLEEVEDTEEGEEDLKLENEFLDHQDTELSVRDKTREKKKTASKTVDPCSPMKVDIPVFDIIASSLNVKVKPSLPKPTKLDLNYKMRHAIEKVYPRISAAANMKRAPLPELRPRTPTPPDTPPEDLAQKKKKKKN